MLVILRHAHPVKTATKPVRERNTDTDTNIDIEINAAIDIDVSLPALSKLLVSNCGALGSLGESGFNIGAAIPNLRMILFATFARLIQSSQGARNG